MRTIRLLAAAVGAALAPPALAQVASTTLPTGAQHGTGISVSTSGAEMTVTQSGAREIINWQSFSIGSGAHVRFQQPGASSVVLNRVVGNNPSEIFGRLSSNGQVFLTNPNGVLFAPGASVEVGSILATTLSISDQDFLAGNNRLHNAGAAREVVNKGSITIVTPNGYAALAGPKVRNDGIIIAQLGTVALAAGERVTMDMVGNRLVNVSVDQAVLDASIVNSGTIEANGGRVLMTARTANALLDTVINTSGVVRANRLDERHGEIVLDAGTTGNIAVSGTLEADVVTVTGGLGGGGEVIVEPGPIVAVPGPITGGGTITLNTSGDLTLSNVTTIAHPLTLAGPTITATNANGVTLNSTAVPEAVEAVKPMPQSGNVSVTSPGTLAPMQHSIEGAGVNAPAGVTLLPRPR
jgi:filamentous hemagglutinin family protein